MWKVALLVSFASVVLQEAAAQGGAESIPFPGFLPSERIREIGPEADDQPNDVYAHLPVRRPKLEDDEVVIYPHHFGFEFGQDPEHHIYEVHSAKELASLSRKHGKHGKHAHDHDHDHHDKASKGASKDGSKTLNHVPASTSNPAPPPPPLPPSAPAHPFPQFPSPSSHGALPPPPPYPYRPNPGFPHQG
ncbi:uncharacterized protein [Macrobrachium rosenbergii]|uniref:uncharacterized protein n=1 Tax=Macrobrachium rosenbergii TaxID=79674 RepID=UPI0034D6B3E9